MNRSMPTSAAGMPPPSPASAPLPALGGEDIGRQNWIYERILATTNDFAYVFDPQGRFLFANARLLKVWAKTLEQIIGKTCHELGYPTWHADMHMREIAEIIRTKRPIRGEVPFTGDSGISGVYDYIFTPVLDATGEVEIIVGTTRDITVRKRAEELLLEKARLASLRADISETFSRGDDLNRVLQCCTEALVRHLDAAFARIWVLDDAGEVLELRASAGIYTHLDGPHGRVKLGDFKIGRIAQNLKPHISNTVPGDPEVSDPEWARREGMVSFAGYPLTMEGMALGVVAFFGRAPISDTVLAELSPIADGIAQWIKRKQAEAALMQSEERFRAMSDNIAPLAWMSDAAGSLFWYNKRWYDFTGTTLEEMRGEGWVKVHDPAHLPRVLETWSKALAGGHSWEDTFPLRGRDGNYRWFLSRAFPIRDAQGNITLWFGVNTDITELRDVQNALHEANVLLGDKAAHLESIVLQRTQKLSETIAELEAFSYSISHDMRAPLRTMIGYAEVLKEDHGAQLDAMGLEHLDRIARASRRMDQLIQDVLVFSRLSRDEVVLQPVDADSLLRDILNSYPNLHPEAADISIRSPLPPILGNAALLTQCFSNLLDNAVKFSQPGRKAKIEVWSESGDGRVRIHFRDEGIGMADHHLDKIFNIFHRVGRGANGTGIGLAIVRKAAEKMGGAIGVESEPGKGSMFWLDLSCAES